jgi:hypothetical protein
MWMQYDFGEGPRVNSIVTQLFCAWLAWSRFRAVLALRDKTLPSAMAAIDAALRIFGGAPTYCLSDNKKDGDARACGRDRGAQSGGERGDDRRGCGQLVGEQCVGDLARGHGHRCCVGAQPFSLLSE